MRMCCTAGQNGGEMVTTSWYFFSPITLAEEMGPIPSQLVKDSRTDPTAGNQTSQRTSRVGTTTISVTTTRSTELRWSMPLYLRLATRTSSVGAATGLGRMRGTLPRPRSQELKMLFFWFSMLLQSPSMSLGFFRKDWMAGIITVDAKSGRVSRSMNWAMDLACETNSTDFFWRAVYEALSALSFVAMTLGSALTTMFWASAEPT